MILSSGRTRVITCKWSSSLKKTGKRIRRLVHIGWLSQIAIFVMVTMQNASKQSPNTNCWIPRSSDVITSTLGFSLWQLSRLMKNKTLSPTLKLPLVILKRFCVIRLTMNGHYDTLPPKLSSNCFLWQTIMIIFCVLTILHSATWITWLKSKNPWIRPIWRMSKQ